MERLNVIQHGALPLGDDAQAATEGDAPSAATGCGPSCGCGSEARASGAALAEAAPALELEQVREQLSEKRGPRFWKSLEQLAATPEFEDMLHREFPRQALDFGDGHWSEVSRRRFLQLSAASLALAGLTGCTRQPTEKIAAYVNQPEQLVPGQPLYFATAFPMDGYGVGVLAESHMGRPTKIEGNPDHPASLGATDLFAQASVLQLYDPDRSRAATYLGDIRDWKDLVAEVEAPLTALEALGGDGLRILTGTVTSPTEAAQIEALLERFPSARWHRWDAAGAHNSYAGTVEAFGGPVDLVYDLSRADVVLALDADFLTQGKGAVRYARDWARRRRSAVTAAEGDEGAVMSRLYALESMPTGTGSVADNRLPATPTQIAAFTLALASELGAAGGSSAPLPEPMDLWLREVAADLRAHSGSALVVAGESLPPAVHALAHAINGALGAYGSTAQVLEPVAADPVDHLESISELARDLQAGRVDTLVIVGTNPVFTAPADLAFTEAIQRARLRIHMGLYTDETAEYCQWHIPQSHYLESWGDIRAWDGTVTFQQPLIEPLFASRTPAELFALLAGKGTVDARGLLEETWQGRLPGGGDFDTAFRQALNRGFVEGTEAASRGGAGGSAGQAAARVAALLQVAAEAGEESLELSLRPDPAIWDGSWANSGWLQELPRPITKLTWDNAALVSPHTAAELGFPLGNGARNGENRTDVDQDLPVLALEVDGETVELPLFRVPGMADGVVVAHYGFGRRRAGKVGDGVGQNLYPLRRRASLDWAMAAVRPTGETYPLATTQHHHTMHGRYLVRAGTLEHYREEPDFVQHMGHSIPGNTSFYPPYEYDGHKWGMAVDLGACTGCNACVVACQSENNVPVVGKEQVMNGREMHWLRIDAYFEGADADHVDALYSQPVLCQQCELAPCEPVCPVAATVHSEEGLNDMVYNRCVGTRYCSNNCPYKVRRFNFLSYTDHETELVKMGRNPDVTVRTRGVMEKCTYCVQRISHARIQAKVEGQWKDKEPRIPDGTIQTACQQACPSEAMIFGDLNDPESEVARLKALPLNYNLLDELGTKPRTTYLARLTNPNPALVTETPDHGSH